MASFLKVLVSFLVVAVVAQVERSEATNYTVGDTTGWGVPSNNEFYDNWESGKTFRVGDFLIFNWAGNHDVVPVSEAQYDACTKVTTGVISTSPAIVPLTAVGDFHFICTIGTHCSSGQKLSIEVIAAAASSPPPPSTNTSSGSTPPPPPSTTTSSTSPPPPPSSSASFGPMVALSGALSMLAFFL